MPIDPRGAADHAAKVSALRHALHLIGAHAEPSMEKTACTKWLAGQVARLTGGAVRRCRCGRPLALSPEEVQAHDQGERVARCRSCRNNLRGARFRP